MGQGSGSVTTFSRADGFATIGRHQEIVQAGTMVDVQLLGADLQLAGLVVIAVVIAFCLAQAGVSIANTLLMAALMSIGSAWLAWRLHLACD